MNSPQPSQTGQSNQSPTPEPSPHVENDLGLLFKEIALPRILRPLVEPFELTVAQSDFAELRAKELDKRKQSRSETATGALSQGLEDSPTPSLRKVWESLREVAILASSVSKGLSLSCLGLSVFSTTHPVIIGYAIEGIGISLKEGEQHMAALWGGSLFLMTGCAIASSFLSGKLSEQFAWRLYQHLEERFLSASGNRAFGKIDDADVAQDLNELGSNRWRLNNFLWQTMGGVGTAISFGVALGGLGAAYSWHLAGYFAVAIIPCLVADFASSHFLDYFERKQAELEQEIKSKKDALTDSKGVRELQANQSVDWAVQSVDARFQEQKERRFSTIRASFNRRLATTAPLLTGGAASLAAVLYDTVTGITPPMSLPATTGAIASILFSGLALSNSWGQLLASSGYTKRILSVLRSGIQPSSAPTKEVTRELNLAPFRIAQVVVRNVELPRSNDPEQQDRSYRLSVKDIAIKQGDFLGIVGRQGAGKTTFLKVLQKEIEAGKIDISVGWSDDTGEQLSTSLSSVEIAEWLSRMSILYQDTPELKGLSVREAICLNKKVDDAEIWKTMQVTGLSEAREFAESGDAGFKETLQKFLDTKIGSDVKDGRSFSGGEKRLIALTRTMLQSHEIVVLDEPGEGLSPEFEADMVQRIRNFCRDNKRALIVVSHRYGTLLDADAILVFKSGEIVSKGTHDELIASGSPSYCEDYARAYVQQIQALVRHGIVSIDPQGRVKIT